MQSGHLVRVHVDDSNTKIGTIVAIDETKVVVEGRNDGVQAEYPLARVEPAMLVVLEFNGVLGERDDKPPHRFPQRPDVMPFLKFLFSNFVVGVWSSCARRNVDNLMPGIFQGFQSQVLFCMSRDDATAAPRPEKQHATIKNMSKVWALSAASQFNDGNTIVVDHCNDKFSRPDLLELIAPWNRGRGERGLKDLMVALAARVAPSTTAAAPAAATSAAKTNQDGIEKAQPAQVKDAEVKDASKQPEVIAK